MLLLTKFVSSWLVVGFVAAVDLVLVALVFVDAAEDDEDLTRRQRFLKDTLNGIPAPRTLSAAVRRTALACGASAFLSVVITDIVNATIFWPWTVVHVTRILGYRDASS